MLQHKDATSWTQLALCWMSRFQAFTRVCWRSTIPAAMCSGGPGLQQTRHLKIRAEPFSEFATNNTFKFQVLT